MLREISGHDEGRARGDGGVPEKSVRRGRYELTRGRDQQPQRWVLRLRVRALQVGEGSSRSRDHLPPEQAIRGFTAQDGKPWLRERVEDESKVLELHGGEVMSLDEGIAYVAKSKP
jgi:hypothetical protein